MRWTTPRFLLSRALCLHIVVCLFCCVFSFARHSLHTLSAMQWVEAQTLVVGECPSMHGSGATSAEFWADFRHRSWGSLPLSVSCLGFPRLLSSIQAVVLNPFLYPTSHWHWVFHETFSCPSDIERSYLQTESHENGKLTQYQFLLPTVHFPSVSSCFSSLSRPPR